MAIDFYNQNRLDNLRQTNTEIMKKNYLILLNLIIAFNGFSQLDSYLLNQNGVAATIANGGVFFNRAETELAGYEVPAGSGNHGIYALSFWFGGEDLNGQLKLAATTYSEESDFFPGALTNNGVATVPVGETSSKGIYPVTRAEIEYHIAHFGDVGYSIPSSIINWPAHGDVTLEMDFYLAPFVDTDGDGIYDPSAGDYPKIKGDKAVYMIVNDKADIHLSGGDAIGLELHYLIYQYESDDYLNDATFINIRVINRGTQTLFGFKTACFVDCDLGDPTDDYVGFNAASDLMYCYNGFNTDGIYGTNPPAIGVALLNQDADKFVSMGGAGGPTGLPNIAMDYYNYMKGNWKNGIPFTYGDNGYGGEVPTDYLYDGIPGTESWTEASVENTPGDRRIMMSASLALDILRPFEQLCFDYVVLYNRDGNHIENATNLFELANQAEDHIAADGGVYCNAKVAGLTNIDKLESITVYPNPSNGSFTIDVDGNFDLIIHSIDGRLVYQSKNLMGGQPIETSIKNGTYFIKITQNGRSYEARIVIYD